MGVSKLRLLRLWRPIKFCANLWLRWGLKKSCSPHWELSKGMWRGTCTQVSQGDSWLLVVGSQIGSLNFNPSFGHNLCFKYSNGSCEPILDIYVSRAFQWGKEVFNPMSFVPWNCLAKIRESIRTPIPKVVPTWECVGSFLDTLLQSREYEMWFPVFTFGLHLCKPLPWLQAQG